jgi:cytoskeletal protein CcmA (bactofilin family)
MSIFKKTETPPQKPRDRGPAPSRAPQGDGAISIIASGMNVVGDVTTEGTVRVEGTVRGTIRAAKSIVLGPGGLIEGNVFTLDAVIGGTVTGSIVAGARLELQNTCSVTGEIRTRAEHLKLEEGARFAGQVKMIEQNEKIDEWPLSDPHPQSLGEASTPPRSAQERNGPAKVPAPQEQGAGQVRESKVPA